MGDTTHPRMNRHIDQAKDGEGEGTGRPLSEVILSATWRTLPVGTWPKSCRSGCRAIVHNLSRLHITQPCVGQRLHSQESNQLCANGHPLQREAAFTIIRSTSPRMLCGKYVVVWCRHGTTKPAYNGLGSAPQKRACMESLGSTASLQVFRSSGTGGARNSNSGLNAAACVWGFAQVLHNGIPSHTSCDSTRTSTPRIRIPITAERRAVE